MFTLVHTHTTLLRMHTNKVMRGYINLLASAVHAWLDRPCFCMCAVGMETTSAFEKEESKEMELQGVTVLSSLHMCPGPLSAV